jgi:antibiotic biosynthesis monooxygenase (ABM) superfamily enzyme
MQELASAANFVSEIYSSFQLLCMQTKMKLIASLKIWIVIYPSITLFYYLFGEQLSALPLYQRTFLLTISLVPWMMFAGVPFVEAILKRVKQKNEK